MSAWSGKRVLVTGGEGFIGSHLIERLVNEEAEVAALAHYNPFGKRGWLDKSTAREVEVLLGDVRDQERVFDAIEGRDVVFHLAALIGIPYSYEAPESYVQVNVHGTYNVVNACRRAGVERMVHTSTSETYGSALYVPIDESHPLQPQSPYSATKIGGDMIALSYYHSFETPVSVVRPFNTYGPRQSARAVIPAILIQLHSGAQEIRLGSTTPTRDMNFVADTVSGLLAVAGCEKCLGNVVNIGSGREISIGDLVELIVKMSGRSANVVQDPARIRPGGSEVQRLLCDNTRAKEWCGWEPQFSLEDGLKLTSDWIAENIDSFRAKDYQV